MSGPRVLLLHGGAEDYLADSLLHGLRSLLGADLLDAPRADALYDDLPPERRAQLYGNGFTLYTRLPPLEVDRERPLERTLAGEFDVVVLADVQRNWQPWLELAPHLETLAAHGTTVVAVDGGDNPTLFPHGPAWWRSARRLPPIAGRVAVFKRELVPLTARMRCLGLLPQELATRALARHVRPIAFSIPAELIATGEEPKTRLLATHVVDAEVAARVDAPVSYAFADETAYYADLRASRFGVTTRRAGWDCMRHYELAASGCVPCFRDLDAKPALCAPHGLDAGNCVVYRDADDLLAQIESMPEGRYARLRAGALAWARANTTVARARQLLAAVGHPLDAPADQAS